MQKLDKNSMLHYEFHKSIVDDWVDPDLIVGMKMLEQVMKMYQASLTLR